MTTYYYRYCDDMCQLAHWTDPADPHRAHCGGSSCKCRRKKPEWVKQVHACANCGTHKAAKACSACSLDGGVKVRCCDEACQLQHWRSATDPHKACCHKTRMS
jgi:hypothetical protein